MRRSAKNLRPNNAGWIHSGLIRRAIWLALLLMHLVPAMEASSAGGAVALWTGLGFFGLKSLDVPCLRWRLTRSATMTLLLATAVVHADIKPGTAASALAAELPAMVVSVAAIDALRRISRRFPGLVEQLRSALRYDADFVLVMHAGLRNRRAGVWHRRVVPVVAARPPPR